MEIGIHTFGELVPDPHTHQKISAHERLKHVIRMAILADEVGLDIFGVGEHHRLDIAASAPPVVLAAIAQVTTRIRLTSTATVLSTADPVRVFEEFATLDLLSDGRAEIIAGRGAFVVSFELFGFDLKDYDDLFAEKIDLLTRLNDSERITWQGRIVRRFTRPRSRLAPCRLPYLSGLPLEALRRARSALAPWACPSIWASLAARLRVLCPWSSFIERRVPAPGMISLTLKSR